MVIPLLTNNSLIAVARREQSDRASKLIGEKLLQGYCLLEEICPTNTCYGVPTSLVYIILTK